MTSGMREGCLDGMVQRLVAQRFLSCVVAAVLGGVRWQPLATIYLRACSGAPVKVLLSQVVPHRRALYRLVRVVSLR